MQERGGGNSIAVVSGTTTPSTNRYDFPTTKPYDAVELSLERRGAASVDPYRVVEFCSE